MYLSGLNFQTTYNHLLGSRGRKKIGEYEYYLHNFIFGAWLTEVCVFFSFFQTFVFNFCKRGENIDVELSIIFFQNECLKICDRLNSSFWLNCGSVTYMNVYNDQTSKREREREREREGAGHFKFNLSDLPWIIAVYF